MAKERRSQRTDASELFDSSLMYDDIEKIRAREEEIERNENSKLSFAGMIALIAGVGLLITTFVGGILPGDVMAFLPDALRFLGFAGLGYGFYKMIKMVFRRNLNFPSLSVYRKTKPKSRSRTIPVGGTGINAAPNARQESSRSRPRPRQYSNDRRRKRSNTLRRSRSNRVFAGVAGGIAEYTGVSAALVRFAFLIGLFVSGGMVTFAYLLLSIILPTYYEGRDD